MIKTYTSIYKLLLPKKTYAAFLLVNKEMFVRKGNSQYCLISRTKYFSIKKKKQLHRINVP